MPNAFTTKLEAVNIILQMLDEEPVNSLNGELPLEATNALSSIEEISKSVQQLGWHFNTEYEFPLIPESNGEITLPQSTLECDVEPYANGVGLIDLIQRGTRLYDRKNRTYDIGKTLKATIVSLLEWEDLPEPFRRWINVRAGRTLYNRTIGDRQTDTQLAREEVQAKAAAENFDARTQDTTVFNNPTGFSILNRRMRRRSGRTNIGY